jgi:hypothetical protein
LGCAEAGIAKPASNSRANNVRKIFDKAGPLNFGSLVPYALARILSAANLGETALARRLDFPYFAASHQ